GWGRSVFVTSSVVREPNPILVLSNSVRMAVHGFAKALSKEVAADGITVNCVMPGSIDTDRMRSIQRSAADATGRSVDEVRSAGARAIPTRRIGEPSEFGAVVAFLCSTQAAYVNGA